jgi:hypothetical protein
MTRRFEAAAHRTPRTRCGRGVRLTAYGTTTFALTPGEARALAADLLAAAARAEVVAAGRADGFAARPAAGGVDLAALDDAT